MASLTQHGSWSAIGIARGRGFEELGAALRGSIAAITQRWVAQLRVMLPSAARLTDQQLQDGVPEMLGLLANALENPAEHALLTLTEVGSKDGTSRFQAAFSLEEMMGEGCALRRMIFETVDEALGHPLHRDEHAALLAAIDVVLQGAMAAYVGDHIRQLRQAAEAEAKYFSYMSHDLMNNLHSIVLLVEAHRRHLSSKAAIAEEFAEDLEELGVVLSMIKRTCSGVDRLLQAERLRAGAAQARVETFHLREPFSEVVSQVTKEAARKGLKLETSVPDDAEVHTDRDWTTVILQNLIGNAVKYTSAGVIQLKAQRQMLGEKQRWVILVQDQGPGISSEHLSHIFDSFHRGETHGQSGVGLGLAIAGLAARLLGGELTATSELGHGTCFYLTLPAEGRFEA